MPYTIANRGRPIGTTDLEFVRIGDRFRSGWFHPNALGERLMPVITGVSPAVRAYLHGDAPPPDDGTSAAEPAPPDAATRAADLAEALQHAGALELTLHREDGTLVPTESIGIQDTEWLLAQADRHRAEEDPESDDTVDDEELARAVEHDLAIMREWLEENAPPWKAEEEPGELPRYQVHVRLVDEEAMP